MEKSLTHPVTLMAQSLSRRMSLGEQSEIIGSSSLVLCEH